MLMISWRRWVSLIADSGREMDLPLRLLNGEQLYRDVHYLYPPLSPYFNALLYRIFGAQLEVLQASGVVCSIVIVWLCYRIALRLLSPGEATIAVMAVIVWCVFKPAGNLISPYAYAALHGMMTALGALLSMLRYAERGLKRDLLIAGALVGLAAITKQEFAVSGAATVAVSLAYLHRIQIQSLLSDLALAALPAAAITLPVYAWLFQRLGRQTLVEDCHLFYTHLPDSLIYYNAHRTGLDHPFLSFAQMLGAAAVGIAAVSAIVLLSDRTRVTFQRAGAILAGSLCAIVAIRLISGSQWDGSPLRALPIFLLVIIAFEWRRRRENGWNGDRAPALFITAVYSFAVLARVTLRVPSGGAFGGFFLPASMILFCYLFVRALPHGLELWTGDAGSARRARLIGVGLLIAMLIATAIVFAVRYRSNFSEEIRAERGRLFAARSSGPAIGEALRFIEQQTRPGEAIAVLPEGSDLAFLTGRRAPLRHQILIPGLMSEQDEHQAIAKLEAEHVRYVFIVNRPMREFGAEAFGKDFYPTLGNWIDEHYRIVKIFGGSPEGNPAIGDPEFFIKVLEREEKMR